MIEGLHAASDRYSKEAAAITAAERAARQAINETLGRHNVSLVLAIFVGLQLIARAAQSAGMDCRVLMDFIADELGPIYERMAE